MGVVSEATGVTLLPLKIPGAVVVVVNVVVRSRGKREDSWNTGMLLKSDSSDDGDGFYSGEPVVLATRRFAATATARVCVKIQ